MGLDVMLVGLISMLLSFLVSYVYVEWLSRGVFLPNWISRFDVGILIAPFAGLAFLAGIVGINVGFALWVCGL